MLSLGLNSKLRTALSRFRSPASSESRPRRGMIALLICVIVRPGLFASRKAWSIVAPGVRPLPALVGTVAGGLQVLPPPVELQEAPPVHCAADKWGLVQPIVSKPGMLTLLCMPTK